MKIFIINLKRSGSRRSIMERKLKMLNLNYDIFEGIDGYRLTREDFLRNVDQNHCYPRQFNKGELGCFMSHYLVYKKIVEENLPYALILEDDINFSPRFPELLKIMEPQIIQGDVISFYTTFTGPCKLYVEDKIDDNYFFIKPYDGESVFGAVAYIVTYCAAKKLIDNILPMYNIIDDWQYWQKKRYVLNFKIVFPHPVDITDNYSDVNESFGGLGLRIKKLLVNSNFPVLSNLILKKRRRLRWCGRMNNILINGKKPDTYFL